MNAPSRPETVLQAIESSRCRQPTEEENRFVSRCLWTYRGKKEQTPEEAIVKDWEKASWMIGKLGRPYLAVDACVNGAALAKGFREMFPEPTDDTTTYAIFLEDGAFERSDAIFLKHRANCVTPESLIEPKDDLFALRLTEAIISFDGHPVLRNGASPHNVSERLFQDGIAVRFVGPGSALNAVACSIAIHRSLGDLNEENRHNWQDRVHARVSISNSWEGCLALSRFVRRSSTVLDATMEQFSEECIPLISAAGIRRKHPNGVAEPRILSLISGSTNP